MNIEDLASLAAGDGNHDENPPHLTPLLATLTLPRQKMGFRKLKNLSRPASMLILGAGSLASRRHLK
jgi:hypothetical protein